MCLFISSNLYLLFFLKNSHSSMSHLLKYYFNSFACSQKSLAILPPNFFTVDAVSHTVIRVNNVSFKYLCLSKLSPLSIKAFLAVAARVMDLGMRKSDFFPDCDICILTALKIKTSVCRWTIYNNHSTIQKTVPSLM